jgi:hypothetical protein
VLAVDLFPARKRRSPLQNEIGEAGELLLDSLNLIAYDFQWAGKNKKVIIDKFTNEVAAAANLK